MGLLGPGRRHGRARRAFPRERVRDAARCANSSSADAIRPAVGHCSVEARAAARARPRRRRAQTNATFSATRTSPRRRALVAAHECCARCWNEHTSTSSTSNVARVGLVASARDEPPRSGERRDSQHEPRQTEAQIRRYRAVTVPEQVPERAPRDKGCAATEQDQNNGRQNAHYTMYARTDSWLRHLDRPTTQLP